MMTISLFQLILLKFSNVDLSLSIKHICAFPSYFTRFFQKLLWWINYENRWGSRWPTTITPYRGLGVATRFLSLYMRSCIIHHDCSIAERDPAIFLHFFLQFCNLHGNKMGLLETSSETTFHLVLQHLSWRNHSFGGDEPVRSFRTGDADITTYAQSLTVELKYL